MKLTDLTTNTTKTTTSGAVNDLLEIGCTHFVCAVPISVLEKNASGDFTVYHMVGYWEQPAHEDIALLAEELAVDEELGMIGRVHLEDYVLLIYDEDSMQEIQNPRGDN